MKRELLVFLALVFMCQGVLALDYEMRVDSSNLRVGEQFKVDVYAKSAQDVRYLQGDFVLNWDQNYLEFVSVVPNPDFPWVTSIFAPSNFQNYPDGTRSGINQINFDREDGDSLYWLRAGYPSTPQADLPLVSAEGYKLFSIWFEPKIEGSTVVKLPTSFVCPAEPECQQQGTTCVNYFRTTSNCLPLNSCPIGSTNQLNFQITTAPSQPQGPICGNGIVESGEVCDSTFINGIGCTEQGFHYGTLKCNSDCQRYDTSECENYDIEGVDLTLSSDRETAEIGEEFEITIEYKSEEDVPLFASDVILKWDPVKVDFVSLLPEVSSDDWFFRALIVKQGAGVNNNPQYNEGSLAEGIIQFTQAASIQTNPNDYPKATVNGLPLGKFKFKSKTNDEIVVEVVKDHNFPSTIDNSIYPPRTCSSGENCRIKVDSRIFGFCDRNNPGLNLEVCLRNRGNVKLNQGISTTQESGASEQENIENDDQNDEEDEDQNEIVSPASNPDKKESILEDFSKKEADNSVDDEEGSLEEGSSWMAVIEFLSKIRGFIFEKIGND